MGSSDKEEDDKTDSKRQKQTSQQSQGETSPKKGAANMIMSMAGRALSRGRRRSSAGTSSKKLEVEPQRSEQQSSHLDPYRRGSGSLLSNDDDDNSDDDSSDDDMDYAFEFEVEDTEFPDIDESEKDVQETRRIISPMSTASKGSKRNIADPAFFTPKSLSKRSLDPKILSTPKSTSKSLHSRSIRTKEREEKTSHERSHSRGRTLRSSRTATSEEHRKDDDRKNDEKEKDDDKEKKRATRSRSLPRQKSNLDDLFEEMQLVRSRARSIGRSSRSITGGGRADRSVCAEVSKSQDSSEQQPSGDGKKRKSKMEKILQLQDKNQRYKDEFRKVQKDRKTLKKELETHKEETNSLNQLITAQISEISTLKQQLAEALEKIERGYNGGDRDMIDVRQHEEELRKAKENHNRSVMKVEELSEDVTALEASITYKENYIKDLQNQIKLQRELVEGLQDENENLRLQTKESSLTGSQVAELSEENERLKAELEATVRQASEMVKEREDAIADLLRENDEMKRIMAMRDEASTDVSKDQFVVLKQELANANAALEEAQDRNVSLEEEIEMLAHKADELDNEQIRLRDDLEAWQEKATAAQQTASLVERSAEDARRRAAEAEARISELEQRYKEDQAEADRQHKAALAAIEKAAYEKALAVAETKARAPPNPQEMMLQAAVANRESRKQAQGWGGLVAAVRGGVSQVDENSTEAEKRIKELETINADQEEDVKKLKSEMVRLRSTFNDTMYTNKKRVEQLESENLAFGLKIQALEKELSHVRNVDPAFPDLISASTNSCE